MNQGNQKRFSDFSFRRSKWREFRRHIRDKQDRQNGRMYSHYIYETSYQTTYQLINKSFEYFVTL